MHTGCDHWVAVSTIGMLAKVNVCDSMYGTPFVSNWMHSMAQLTSYDLVLMLNIC